MNYLDVLSFLSKEELESVSKNSVLKSLLKESCGYTSLGKLYKKHKQWKEITQTASMTKLFSGLMKEDESVFSKDNSVFCSIQTLYSKYGLDKESLDSNEIMKELFYFAVSVRIIGVIRTYNIPLLNPEKTTLKKAEEEFNELRNYASALFQGKTAINANSTLGQATSGFYTNNLRLNTPTNDAIAPLVQWNNNKELLQAVRRSVRYMALNTGNEVKDKPFTIAFFRHELGKSTPVSQYKPINVVNLFHEISNEDQDLKNLKKINVSDLTSGWGDRLVGFLSMQERIQYMFLNDINPKLAPEYKKIIQKYASTYKENENYSLSIQPAQFINVNDVIKKGKFHYSVYGLPFFNKEKYEGKGQSHEYGTVSQWFDQFFIPLINVAIRIHETGGYCVINLGNYKTKPTKIAEVDGKLIKSKNIELLKPAEKVISEYARFFTLKATKDYDTRNKSSVLYVLKRTDTASDVLPKQISIEKVHTFSASNKRNLNHRFKKNKDDIEQKPAKRLKIEM